MIKFVTVEYDLDELLTKSVVVSGHLVKVDDVLRGEKSVRRWYRSGYGHGPSRSRDPEAGSRTEASGCRDEADGRKARPR